MLWFLVSVIIAALYWGEGPAVLVAFLSFLALDFGVFHNRFAFASPDLQYFLSLLTFLGVGFLISRLSNDLRQQAQEAKHRAQLSQSLQHFNRHLTQAKSETAIVAAFQEHVALIVPGDPELVILSDGDCKAVWKSDPTSESPPAFLDSFTQQARLALQRLQREKEASEALLVAEREHIQNALLNSLSHDLQTPLASVAGSLQVACDPSLNLEPGVRQELLQLAREQTERLRRLVANLLQITRLDGPGLSLNRQSVEPDELLGVVLDHSPQSLRGRISTKLAEGVPELDVDYVLVVNLLHNLLENAHKYTPEGSPIQLEVSAEEEWVRFDVRDRGPGIPAEDIPRIFDKFYRAEGLEMSGSGLGLFICKGIVDAHKGKIRARLRQGGGLEITCWLPAVHVI